MSGILDAFIPVPDARDRRATLVKAPAELVHEVARNLDMQSIPAVHALFWLRAKLMGAKAPPPARGIGLVDATRGFGWGVLVDEPPHAYVSGAACQPWQPDVVFSPIPADRFAAYGEPDRVKIAWSLETEPVDSTATRFATETRVVATDDDARAKFRRYWRRVMMGIVVIRWLLLRAVRREAERQWRAR
jgi:hypothetical protein